MRCDTYTSANDAGFTSRVDMPTLRAIARALDEFLLRSYIHLVGFLLRPRSTRIITARGQMSEKGGARRRTGVVAIEHIGPEPRTPVRDWPPSAPRRRP